MQRYDLESRVAERMESDERLLWAGRPPQGFVLRPIDWFFVPFSLVWGGFAIFWEAAALASGAPLFFAIWGVPFVLVGLYFIGGRFVVDSRLRARTAYAVTNQRIIILSGATGQRMTSVGLHTLTEIHVETRPDGSGTLRFGRLPIWGAMPSGWPGSARLQVPEFERIPDVQSVYNAIREAQRASV
ncbi:MAG: PH domain-containing protein [Dehalococcoidia bacterium]|nr:MAG: PH domain-containing protein [Dehalococcoidia bacterium]